jgi:small subunit ribosomal protein S8
MSWADPIADMLTRIRNAHMAGQSVVEIPHSKVKNEIARVLKREGYLSDFTVERGARKCLRVYLKYTPDGEPVIRGLRRESRPGLRRYVASREAPRVLGGLGVAIMSTSSGIMTSREARRKKVGGEVLCSVW